MATDNPFDQLGRILSTGGEIAVGLALFHGWSGNRIGGMIATRFGLTDSEAIGELMSVANAAVVSGNTISGADPTIDFNLADIVVNPSLYGDEPAGRRIHWEGEYRFGSEGEWWRTSGDEPSVTALESLLERVAGTATSNEQTYRSKEGLAGDVGSIPPEIRIVLIERRF